MLQACFHIGAWRNRILLAGLVLSLAVPADAAAREQNIHALRSAYLFYFSSLIEWPETSTFENNEITLCVHSSDEEQRYQLGTIDRKNSGERVLRIRFIEDLQTISVLEGCHMFYVDGAYPKKMNEELAAGTLFITEGAVPQRGMIHLYAENNKLMFEIDIEALNNKRFKASSKLLRLSRKEAK